MAPSTQSQNLNLLTILNTQTAELSPVTHHHRSGDESTLGRWFYDMHHNQPFLVTKKMP
jgi:hypothetical protein